MLKLSLRLRSRVHWNLMGKVYTFTPEGMRQLALLREKYPERKKNLKYVEKYSTLLEEFGFRKKRETWNWKVFWAIIECWAYKEWNLAKEIFTYEMGYKHNIVTDDFNFVKSLNPKGQPKVTMASPPVNIAMSMPVVSR